MSAILSVSMTLCHTVHCHFVIHCVFMGNSGLPCQIGLAIHAVGPSMVFYPISIQYVRHTKKDRTSPFPYIFTTFNANGKLITMGDKTEIYKGNYCFK